MSVGSSWCIVFVFCVLVVQACIKYSFGFMAAFWFSADNGNGFGLDLLPLMRSERYLWLLHVSDLHTYTLY